MSMTSFHWGVFNPIVTEGRVVDVRSFALDPDPSLIIRSIPGAVHHPCRVMQPAVREGWLKHGPGGASEGRAGERFISVIWECAFDLVESALKRERKTPPKETS